MTAVLAAFSMLAVLGLSAEPVEAQGSSQFVFQGGGWGHGVGMSQNGARNAADSGVNHVGILNHYYPNTVLAAVPTIEAIRVHIGDATRVEFSSAGSMVFERGGVAINSLPSGTISVSAHDGGLQIGAAWTTGSASDPVFLSFPQPVKVSNNGHRYLWGKLQITNKNGKVRVVEVLPLEQYMAGIAEMPAAWPVEALMAQAIAARTYAHEVTLHRRNSTEWAQEYDISGTTVDQNYIGYDAQDSAWDQKWLAAVSATAGLEIVDGNGAPVRAYYAASNGGYTETAAYVFNNDVAHTVAGPDQWDEGGHDWTNWTRTYSQESMSRWLNAHADTSVGTVTAINVLDGAGASARIDKAAVELIGTGGTKQITGKRLMLVINAGVFGEGGGLSTHLPGTFTTVGNGVGAGPPQPTGQIPVSAVVADVDGEVVPVDENADFTPPPGWTPEPGTGIAPGTGAVAAAPVAPVDEVVEALPQVGGAGDAPPPGWVPEPGTGVPPISTEPSLDTAAAPADSTTTTAPTDVIDTTQRGFAPPPGWTPEPGTGVPPGWTPEPGTGVPPIGWTPEPGTGVAPSTPAADGQATASEASTSDASATETSDTSTSTDAATGTDTGSDVVGGTGGGDAEAVSAPFSATGGPPAGWTPEPGTGVPPLTSASASSEQSVATGGVLLAARDSDSAEQQETTFEVIAPTADRATEARERLEELQERAAPGQSTTIDVDDYVASVAPRPIYGVCSSSSEGVTCVAIEEDN